MRFAWLLGAAFLASAACKGDGPAATSTEAGAGPSLTRPKVTVDEGDPEPVGVAVVTIGRKALWLASSTDAPPTEIAKLDALDTDLIEPLAEALAKVKPPDEPTMVFVGGARALLVDADVGTDLGTVRRVLTTARALNYLAITYRAGGARPVYLEALARSPVDGRAHAFTEPLIVSARADGSFALNRRALSSAELSEVLESQLRPRSDKCVGVDADDAVAYAAWFELVVRLKRAGSDCVTLLSAAAERDAKALEPPPPPPPPADAGEAPDAPAPPPMVAPAARARVRSWWERTRSERLTEQERECRAHLADARKSFEAEVTPTTLRVLTLFERDCGDAARALELRRMRTTKFPDDVRGWHELAMAEFDILWPDAESGSPSNDEVPAAERRAAATRSLAAIEEGLRRAPKDRALHVLAQLGLLQRALAAESEPAAAEARKRAEVHRQMICTIDELPPCGDGAARPCCPASAGTATAEGPRRPGAASKPDAGH